VEANWQLLRADRLNNTVSAFGSAPFFVEGRAMICCIRFRAFEKNTLKGFADFELTRIGIIIRDCTWHEKNGKEWVGFPARSYETKDGTTSWSPLVEFAEGATEARRQFQEQAVAATTAVTSSSPPRTA
jgi:hypothetical protein